MESAYAPQHQHHVTLPETNSTCAGPCAGPMACNDVARHVAVTHDEAQRSGRARGSAARVRGGALARRRRSCAPRPPQPVDAPGQLRSNVRIMESAYAPQHRHHLTLPETNSTCAGPCAANTAAPPDPNPLLLLASATPLPVAAPSLLVTSAAPPRIALIRASAMAIRRLDRERNLPPPPTIWATAGTA